MNNGLETALAMRPSPNPNALDRVMAVPHISRNCRPRKRHGNSMSKRNRDISGQRFGRLVAVSFSHTDDHIYWFFKCDCGVKKVLRRSSVISGGTKSCGCFSVERSRAMGHAARTHGISGTPLYYVYSSMIERCYRVNKPSYSDYGGRGIRVCRQWKGHPSAFFEWALANGYKAGLELDRKNNNKGYSPHNCRFVTRSVNGSNKRNNVLVTFDGRTLTVAEWARRLGIGQSTLYMRVRRGWCHEDTVTAPIGSFIKKRKRRKKTHALRSTE
jgi:hypothetical protein